MKRRFAFLLFLLPLAGAASADALDSVERRIQAGHHAVALLELERLGVNSVRSRFLRATALAGAGQTEEAIALYRGLMEERPALPEPYNNLAALYARTGRLEEAKDVLEQGIRTRESYATIYENLSSVYVEMARDSYVKALRLEEDLNPPKLQLISRLDSEPSAREAIRVASVEESPAAERVKPAETPTAEPKPPVTKPAPPAREPEPPAPVAPLPATATAPPLEQTVLAALERWAIAWSDQDAGAYLDAYAPDYVPEEVGSRAAWEADRRNKVTRPAWIKVELRDIKLEGRAASDAEVTVSVVQDYEAPNYRDRTHKEITLVEQGGRWLIIDEKSLKTVRR